MNNPEKKSTSEGVFISTQNPTLPGIWILDVEEKQELTLDTSFKGEIFFKTSQTSQILKSGGRKCPKMSCYCLHSYNYCISFFFRFSLFQAPLQRRLFGVNSLFLLLAQ